MLCVRLRFYKQNTQRLNSFLKMLSVDCFCLTNANRHRPFPLWYLPQGTVCLSFLKPAQNNLSCMVGYKCAWNYPKQALQSCNNVMCFKKIIWQAFSVCYYVFFYQVSFIVLMKLHKSVFCLFLFVFITIRTCYSMPANINIWLNDGLLTYRYMYFECFKQHISSAKTSVDWGFKKVGRDRLEKTVFLYQHWCFKYLNRLKSELFFYTFWPWDLLCIKVC